MATTRKYWKGLDELKETPEFLATKDQEFPSQMTVEEFLSDENLKETSTARRDFLKFLGFSVAAATVAACEAPVTKAIPYVNKPENVTPGMPTWYASTYYDGVSYASILVKTREGRPIYIKGNKDFGIANGGTNPQIIASVLGLYDSSRLQNPQKSGKDISWSNLDAEVKSGLKSAKKIVLVSNTIISPSMQAAISEFASSTGATVENEKFEHIQYDAVSYAGMRAANKVNFGDGFIPSYDFSKAKTIVSIAADFLATWLMPTQFATQYGQRRNPDGEWMSKHFQFESVMSLTGSNADYRGMIKPSEQATLLAYILKAFNVNTGISSDISKENKLIADLAIKSLKTSKGNSLVVSGSNDTTIQLLTNRLNHAIGAYGITINTDEQLNLFRSEDDRMMKFVADTISGKVADVVLFYGVNPVYTLPNGKAFGEALKNVKLTVSFASHADETASKCTFIAPDHHALESWADYNPTTRHFALAQPTIRPLFNTASAIESMLVWASKNSRAGKDSKVTYDFIRNIWENSISFSSLRGTDLHTFWNMAVHNSCVTLPIAERTPIVFKDAPVKSLPKNSGLEVVLYQKAGIGIGMQANNPWLQELPDPITKVTWDNYITMNPVEMEKAGFVTTYDQENGLSLASLKVGSEQVTLPVYPLPGQAIGTVGVALGYGRGVHGESIGKAAYQTKEYGGNATDEKGNLKPIGANVFAFVQSGKTLIYDTTGMVSKVSGVYPIAATQIHHTVMGRHSIVRETTLGIFKSADKEAYNPAHKLQKLDKDGNHVEKPVGEFDLWDAHPVENIGHRWGMTVDLSSCIGCSACLIACQSENNVPVVGKDEVRRGREMHWLRIDRYFASDEEVVPGLKRDEDAIDYGKAEIASVNPKVVHMPMMCHHCNHAPCETVCPVAATTHSNEGLNQMAYNRCIGTRYCANNCPYKVRRFNWFNYPSYKKFTEVNPAQDDLGRMVLNPDVTVRTRGVMEKCSFCVQRIQSGKLVAKKEGRPVVDGDFVSACADACPTNAIVVGDWNDLKSMVRTSSSDNRAYQALEEVGVKPNVWYKVKVRNEDNSVLAKHQVVASGHESHSDKKAHH
jgi:MoCo/4Fe-4S cofactor protein with predicted Tat translocation signal